MILDKDLLAFDPQAAKDVEILQAMGFINTERSQVCITEEGRQFVQALKR